MCRIEARLKPWQTQEVIVPVKCQGAADASGDVPLPTEEHAVVPVA